MLNPVHLRTLTVVLRTGSFAEAARRLGYTGSAVSQQISALERQVKAPLFERAAHSVRPTPAAEFIAERCSEALGSLQALEEDIASMLDGTVGRLRIGSFPTAAERLLPGALSAFTNRNPQVAVHLDEGEPTELLGQLESRELDVALIYRYDLAPRGLPRGLRGVSLLVEELLLVVPSGHPAAGTTEVDLAALSSESWISTRDGTDGAIVLRRLCGAAGFEPSIAHRSNDYDVIHGLIRAGLGIAVVPALGHVPGTGLVARPVPGDGAARQVLLVRSQTSRPEPVAQISEALGSAAEQLAGHAPGLRLSRDR